MSHTRKALSLVLSLVFLFTCLPLFAASAQEENRVLTIWQSAFVSSAELELPESEWLITRICREFEEANPGVTVDMVYTQDESLMQNRIKAATLAGNAPDIVNVYSGYLVTSLKDVFVDIKALIPADDMEIIKGWEAVAMDMNTENEIYGYPAAGAELGLLIYNKALVAQAGVDLEGEGKPKNAAEFMDALRQIQAAGIQPILARSEDYNTAFMFAFGNWWTQQSGTARVTSNSLGVTKFADDEGYLSSLGMVAQMYEEGLLNKDYTTIPDAAGVFYSGGAAMTINGNWEIPNAIAQLGDNAGIYVAPNFVDDVPYQNATIGGVGQAMCVTTSCEDPQLAVDFLSFYSQKKYVIEMCQLQAKLPQRSDVSPEDLGWAGQPIYEKLLAVTSENLMPWNDNSMQADVMNDFYKQSTLVVIGSLTPLESAQALDATAAAAAANAE